MRSENVLILKTKLIVLIMKEPFVNNNKIFYNF